MFGFEDVWKFFFSFFLVLPIVTFIHEAGHLFFGKITGGKVRIHIGSGNRLLKIGPCNIRALYFWDGWCEYENLKNHTRRHLVAVYLGGPLFTILSMLIVNMLIYMEVFKAGIFTYQFVYFSFYFVFFSLIPIEHNGYPTDGKAAWDVIKRKTIDKNPLG
ncbi:site-2 protease family protein [Fictibacillus barbaricus]|uniref:Peptidase M50 domain-containing protein n=1 Tax=Fictibacillus barbaricus TaxID=182136 RepID=A0ABS2ZGK3_9BACL|nr:site-2 protease family protein [Fictibacillus barbaricus]MBN3546444.1 hypothetical protein [Fictibacillus barbaricus]GGB41083.1 hypothetical protein GCM10007199_02920 [Fictibacillus barbaricus]